MATLSPMIEAAPAVQIHAAAAILAIVLGPFVLFRKSRDRLHKILGYGWITVMAVTALSSFWIQGLSVLGPFGPIHLLSVWTLIALALGLRFAMKRQIAQHQRMLRALYFWALGVAGLFTLLPGRVMHRVFFGADTLPGFALVAMVAVLLWLIGPQGMRLRRALGFKL